MKYFIPVLLIISLCSLKATAQTTPDSKGYWVVENNIKTPKESIIFFYAPNHDLMYKETVSGKKIKLNRQKTVRQLNAVLEEVAVAWKGKNQQREGLALVTKKL